MWQPVHDVRTTRGSAARRGQALGRASAVRAVEGRRAECWPRRRAVRCSLDQLEALAGEVEEGLRLEGGGDVASERIGLAVLDRLRVLDEVTYVRFASVYKGFDEADDFARELTLLRKSTEPKRSYRDPDA